MRLIGYVRVSTRGQVVDGLGLATQERLIRAWVKKADGRKLVRFVRDEALTGTLDETDRPGLLSALGALKAGEAQGLVVSSVDRLARLLTTQEAVLARIWSLDASVFTAEAGEVMRDDADDPMRTAMRQMAGVFAQLDRALVIRRLRNGRATAVEQGRRGSGASPFGWHSERGVLVPVQLEQEGLELMRSWRADGLSLAAIADRANAEGIAARRGRWHATSVGRAVSRT